VELSQMASPFARIVVAALGVSVALFLFHLFLVPSPGSPETGFGFPDTRVAFESSRKNYASAKVSAAGLPIGDSQKYEKIASITQLSGSFDADRRLIEGRIAEYGGVTQLERASGLTGFRTLHLGIGVPPDRFDAFITAIRAIGRTVQIEIVTVRTTRPMSTYSCAPDAPRWTKRVRRSRSSRSKAARPMSA